MVPEKVLKKASRVFHDLDKDESGTITLVELKAGMRALGMPPTTDTSVQAMFDLADSNHDGNISLPEFQSFCASRMAEIQRVYEELDVDKSGQLSSLELRAALESLHLKVSGEDLALLMVKFDSDGSGSISFEEFVDKLLLLPEVSPKAVFESWHRMVVDDAQSEYTVPRDCSEAQQPLLQCVAEKLYCGGVAGAVSRTATAPIDRIKMCLQATPPGSKSPSLSSAFVAMYKEGGLASLWRGNGVNIMKIAPETAIKFIAFDALKLLLAKDPGNVGVGERFAAGGLAGATTQVSVYPMEILKTRMSVSPAGTYNGVADCVRSIVSKEGMGALYKGLGASILGIVPYAGVDLMVNSVVKERASVYYSKQGREPGVTALLASGMASSTVAMLTTYPLNLVRTRLQASGMPGAPVYEGAVDCLKRCIKADGVAGLYRGLLPNMLKVLPATSISYAVYDIMQKRLKASNPKARVQKHK